jgi:hypothetical protein
VSGREFRPPRDLDPREFPEGIRHGTRGEPTGRDLPTEFELNEAAERHRRDEALRLQPHVSWWRRLFAGRFRRR